ncbi:MAG TPA: hypothetical protein PLF22_11120 [Pseudomonadales bacterium]|nr:hypothetical protein [Pseudomonadales bacterium]
MQIPRWVWLLAVFFLIRFFWMQHVREPITAVALADASTLRCETPPQFTSADNPRQTANDNRMPPFRMGAATVTPLAGFSMHGRVLSREDYAFGEEAKYSPTDLAMGWGPMEDFSIATALNITQGGRWYHYSWGSEGPPLPESVIIKSSANMHMIPADISVARALKSINAGDAVNINGWLVRIDQDNGWHWQSSLSREDSGGGACEVVYVCSISK